MWAVVVLAPERVHACMRVRFEGFLKCVRTYVHDSRNEFWVTSEVCTYVRTIIDSVLVCRCRVGSCQPHAYVRIPRPSPQAKPSLSI